MPSNDDTSIPTTDACPTCGAPDYQLICPDTNDVLCGCDYCNIVGQPCWRARRDANRPDRATDLSPDTEAALLELLARPDQTGCQQ